MKIFLHIGVPKAGSSALQWVFSQNRVLLSQYGICYPKCRHELLGGLNVSTLDQATRLIRHEYKNDPSRAAHDLDEAWQTVYKAADARPRILILSSESFFRTLDDATAPDLKRRLASLNGELQVVAYIRRPTDRYLSGVQQRLKLSSLSPVSNAHLIRNRERLEQWENHFPGQLSVFPYDRKQMLGGDVVSDFLSRIGADVDPSQLITADINESLSGEAMAILHGFHRTWYPRSDDQPGRGKSTFLQVLSRLDLADPERRRPQLRIDAARAINESCADDLRWLAARWNIHFPSDADASDARKTSEYPDFKTVDEICELDKGRQRRLAFAAYRRWLPAYMRRISGDAREALKRLIYR